MFYRSRRVPSDAKITLVISGLKLSVRLLDVSDTGMKMTLDEAVPAGTKVRLQAARLDLDGELRWSNGQQAGVTLDHPLSRAQQAELSGAIWAV